MTQSLGILEHYCLTWSHVYKRFQITSHEMKECLGILPPNQRRLAHGTTRCLGHKESHVLATENTQYQ